MDGRASTFPTEDLSLLNGLPRLVELTGYGKTSVTDGFLCAWTTGRPVTNSPFFPAEYVVGPSWPFLDPTRAEGQT